MKKYLVFDVESIGLHGEGYAVGGVLYDHQGWELSEFRFACLPEDAKGDGNGRDWVKANAPAITVTHASPREMRSAFWEVWMKAKKDGAVLVADCGWPVEARFLAACVDDDHTERAWQGPYPMHEAASFLEAAGMDCLGTYEREENELPVHDPLADARQTGRLLFDALAKPPLRPAGDEGWRPIETAPKDGTWILGVEMFNDTPMVWGCMKFDEAWNDDVQGFDPTHWMPLPAILNRRR